MKKTKEDVEKVDGVIYEQKPERFNHRCTRIHRFLQPFLHPCLSVVIKKMWNVTPLLRVLHQKLGLSWEELRFQLLFHHKP